MQLLSGCLHCDYHLIMTRLIDRFDPDREKWSSYLMRAEFYFDSNNITTYQNKKAALCLTMSPETFALLQQKVHAVRYSQPSLHKQRFRDKQRPEHAERGQTNNQPNNRGQKVCYRCGSLTHHHRYCPFINAVCYGCDRKGHIQAVCRSFGKPVRKWKMAQYNGEQTTENIAVDVFSTSTHVDQPQILLQISNVALVFELDTGAAVSLVGPAIWKAIESPHLTSPKIHLFSYGKQPIPVKGECNVTVSCNWDNQTLSLIVVEKACTSLFTLDWIKAFQVDDNALLYNNTPTPLPPTIDCNVIEKCVRDLQRVLDQYPAVFSPGLGLCPKVKARLLLKEDAVPKFVKPRPVPFSRMEAVDKELHRLEDLGIITRVDHSEWAIPIVVVQKPNWKVHICRDYKVTVNPQLHVEPHHIPIPRVDELFAKRQ